MVGRAMLPAGEEEKLQELQQKEDVGTMIGIDVQVRYPMYTQHMLGTTIFF